MYDNQQQQQQQQGHYSVSQHSASTMYSGAQMVSAGLMPSVLGVSVHDQQQQHNSNNSSSHHHHHQSHHLSDHHSGPHGLSNPVQCTSPNGTPNTTTNSTNSSASLYTSLDQATKSTKGASKLRRDLINTEIAQLRELLPLPASTRQRLSQLQLMALVLVYVRKSNYFCNGKYSSHRLEVLSEDVLRAREIGQERLVRVLRDDSSACAFPGVRPIFFPP